MLKAAIVFLVLGLILGALGFGGIGGAFVTIAQVLFFVAVGLFVLFLVLALISPSALGMGDVKLAGLVGLPLGWLGWDAVLLGTAAGFVVQAVLSLVLLAARRIDLRGELPFGPAMLLGAAVAVGWSG